MARVTTVGWVQINNGFDRQCYLPYTVGMLQAYAQRHLSDPQAFRFLMPVFRRQAVAAAAAQLAEADMVCFSTYVWNERLSLAIAAALKQLRPEILTVFGGPQIPEREPEAYLRAHRCVDLLCHGEGERVVLALLEHSPGRAWQRVPSLSYLDEAGRFVQTPREPRITDMREIPSPLLEGVFEPLIAAHPEVEWIGLWETNRGCPFTCAYCDWGSRTKNRVVARDLDTVLAEADWFSEHRIPFIFCCDANFSLLPRDRDIVARVAANKARTGFPQALSVQSTKNFTETSYAIYEQMGRAGLSKGVSLSLQSVHPPTLAAIGRKNIASGVFQDAQHRLAALGIETFTDLILPLPEETYDSFVDGVCRVMADGQHNRIQFNNLSILPNATMGDPVYQRRHGFETVDTDIVNIHGSLTGDDGPHERQRLVVGTRTMSREDWVRTRVFSWMTSLLHFDKLLQIPFVVLHAAYGLDYRRLLTAFMEPGAGPVLDGLRAAFADKARAIQAGDVEFCPSPRWLNIGWPADELALIRLCTEDRLDAFYAEARNVLGAGLPAEARPVLDAALAFNRALIKLPGPLGDRELTVDTNLPAVYRGALAGRAVALRPTPCRVRIARSAETWSDWEDWCRRVVWWGNKRGAYLYGFEVCEAGDPPALESNDVPGRKNRVPGRRRRHDRNRHPALPA